MENKVQIDAAVEAFRQLLLEQLVRVERMENDKAAEKEEKKCLKIGIIDGDGIGPIIVGQAKRVAEKLLSEEITEGKVELHHIEGQIGRAHV